MGAAASFSSSGKDEHSLFLSPEITSFAQVLVTDPTARQVFVKYIKNGTWVNKFPMEQVDVDLLGGSLKSTPRSLAHHDSHSLIPSSSPPEKSYIRMSFEHSNKTSGSINTVLTATTRQSMEFSAKSPTGGAKSPQNVSTPPAYSESYAESCFSKEEMTAVMFVSIFPYFLDSSLYKNWTIKESSMSGKSDSGSADENDGDRYDKELELGLQLTSARREGRAHQLVLGAAAYFDADHLQTMLENKHWMHLVSHVVDKSAISVTISDAKAEGFPLIYSNAAFQKMTGYTSSEVLGKTFAYFQGAESSPLEVSRIQRALKSRKSVRSELINYKKGGKSFKNMLILQPVFDHLNEFCFVLTVQCDITENNGMHSAESIKWIQDLLSLVPYMLVKQ